MTKLDYKKFTLSRINSFIKQINLLKEIDFPYHDSSIALDRIYEHIISQKEGVEDSIMTGEALQSKCDRATKQLFIFHPFLGYITKSADPINSFEIYSSFRRIAESILGEDTHLIISSEWEYYSPVNFTIPPELIEFVFIGLPVSEADNSLIVPLSGHELGHSIWSRFNYKVEYRKAIQKSVSNKFKDVEIGNIIEISLIKCAEYFCDFIGIGLFGESYLYAFGYLIAPKVSKKLTQSHPNAANRALAMTKAAESYGYKVPSNFKDLFKTQIGNITNRYEECLEETEKLSFQMIETIINDIKQLLIQKNAFYQESDHYNEFKNDLLTMVPISNANSLADITNVSWDVYLTDNIWKEYINVAKTDSSYEEIKFGYLNELTLKSFEILEINQRLSV